MNNYQIILEDCYVASADSFEVLEESAVPTSSNSKAKKTVFRTVLQTIDEVNKNGRMYPKQVAQTIVDQLRPIAKNRSLFQEIDHPFTSKAKPEDALRRASMVELKNCGALIRDIYIKENQVIGELETLSGFKGPDLRDLILIDKANIGFSLRMLGRIKKHPTMENVVIPSNPLRAITYDVVTNPSHASARVISITNESELARLGSSTQSIEESDESMLILEGANAPSNLVFGDFMDSLILESFNSYKPSFKF